MEVTIINNAPDMHISVNEAPKHEEHWYYCITDEGEVRRKLWTDEHEDFVNYALLNVFDTLDDAEAYLDHLIVELELKRIANEHPVDWSDSLAPKFHIYYDTKRDKLGVDVNYICRTNDVFFASRADVDCAIETIGRDKLKVYFGGTKNHEA